jgi:hypothetical protein
VYMTYRGIIFACSAVLFIFLPFLAFVAYDRKMSHQQSKIISDSKRKNAIVSSLFPAAVRDKLMPLDMAERNESPDSKHKGSNQLNRPIADLYTDTTVLFAGKLLTYHSFDCESTFAILISF